jgi:ubiquinone/menaquinone biosynthesis C-methylase UbiE
MDADQPICSCSFDFETRHEYHAHPAMRALETEVLGCDYGGTSWTTRQQAEEIPSALGLNQGVKLLEIGAGTGWPGIFLAGISGCDITLVDLPLNALKYATERARTEGLAHVSRAISASGAALPFTDGAFDAIEHSDVLCCLPEKLEMLCECRRVVSQGANMLFFVIAPAPGLNAKDMEDALETGPPFVGLDGDYSDLLEQSGWELLHRKDLTEEYLQALRRLVAGMEQETEVLREIMGNTEFDDHLLRRRQQIAAVERGLLEREMIQARAI